MAGRRGHGGRRLEGAEPRGQLLHEVDVLLPARRADKRGCDFRALLVVAFLPLRPLFLVHKLHRASSGRNDFSLLSRRLTRSNGIFYLLYLRRLVRDFFACFLFGLVFGLVSVYINDRHWDPAFGVVGRCLRQQICRVLGKQLVVSISTRFDLSIFAWFFGFGHSSWILGRHLL